MNKGLLFYNAANIKAHREFWVANISSFPRIFPENNPFFHIIHTFKNALHLKQLSKSSILGGILSRDLLVEQR